MINYFSEVRDDVLGAYYGFYFLEVANYYAREFNDELEMLKLLYQTMRALTNPHIPDALIRCIYELKILTINGQGPQVFQCVNCGNKASSTLYSMQYIESSKVEHLYTFNVKPEILQQLSKVTERLMGLYVDRKFKSLEILETLL